MPCGALLRVTTLCVFAASRVAFAAAPTKPETKAETKADVKSATAPTPKKAKWEFPKIERIAVSANIFGDVGHLNGEQWINQFRNDESFDTRVFGVAPSAMVMFKPWDRVLVGPELRFMGIYESTQGNSYNFGPLFELTARGEYSIHIIEKVDLLFSAQLGLACLFPTADLASEITRLQNQGARLWGGPFLGGVGLLGIGARRPLIGPLGARLELGGGVEHLFLLGDDETISGLHFIKRWSADSLRLSVTLGLEVVF